MAFRFQHAGPCDKKKLAPAYRDLMGCITDIKRMGHTLHLTIATRS
jgi:hypothetical protein